MLPYHSIQVSRPFPVVRQQILELDESWLEATLRTAIEHPEDDLRVRVRRPSIGHKRLTLPMDWELVGGELPRLLTGELELLQVGPAETRIGITMAPRSGLVPEDRRERALAYHAVEIAIRAFLCHLTKTLNALSQFHLLPGQTVGHG